MAKRVTCKKKTYVCIDGPLKDQEIYLSSPETYTFSIQGCPPGRYVDSGSKNELFWKTSK